jgi:hypothetical protein
MDEWQEDEPVLLLRKVLCAWLGQSAWSPNQILRWLEGYDLPPVGHEDEPHLWLLRGLPLAEDRSRAETILAARIAGVLDKQPDVQRPGTRPDQILYNLLMLCAGLSCPDQLAEPLYAMFKRKQLKGEWVGIDHRSSLRAALTENQVDNRLQPVWEGMLEGRADDFLGSNAYDGFEGIVLMPRSSNDRGLPALDAIGKALVGMVETLERHENRRSEVRRLLTQVTETYPGHPNWDLTLLSLADGFRWPRWAVECLPRLCFELDPETGSEQTVCALWEPVVNIVDQAYKLRIKKSFCAGQVLLAVPPKDAFPLINQVALPLEQNRRENPYYTDRSSDAVVAHTLEEIHSQMKREQRPREADIVKTVHARVLEKIGIKAGSQT